MELKVIARIRNDFPEKFGLPRQSSLIKELKGKIVFEKKEKCIKRLSKKGISLKRISQLTGLSKKDIKRILKKE